MDTCKILSKANLCPPTPDSKEANALKLHTQKVFMSVVLYYSSKSIIPNLPFCT